MASVIAKLAGCQVDVAAPNQTSQACLAHVSYPCFCGRRLRTSLLKQGMQKSRTITIAVIEILNEVIPMGLVIHFVGNLQMSAQMRWYVMIGYISRFR